MSINKIAAERNQRALMELVSQPGNDLCADCKNRNPRWASYSLGIFVCVSCASIHRKMGTHISKVKSLTMDTWTKEQVEFMKSMGNVKSNAHYNPDETKHRPPTNMIDSERDSDLEKYIRSKYQYKSFIPRSTQVAALLGPSRSASSAPQRSVTMPPTSSSSSVSRTAPSTAFPPSSSSTAPAPVAIQSQTRSVSQPVVLAPPASQSMQMSQQMPQQISRQPTISPPQQYPQQSQQANNPIWNDLAQLQAPATNSSLPLQFISPQLTQPVNAPNNGLSPPNPFSGLSVSPNNQYPSTLSQQPTGMFPGSTPRSMSLQSSMSTMSSGIQPSFGMPGTSPSMFQPNIGGGHSPSSTFLSQNTTSTTFSTSPLPATNLGVPQNSFAPSSFSQQSSLLYTPQPQAPLQPQASPLFQSQPLGQMQGSPMFQPSLNQAPPAGSLTPTPYGLHPMQPSPQPGVTPFSSPQPPFGGSPSPAPFMQQNQYAQPGVGLGMTGVPGNPFGATGWAQPTNFTGQQPTAFPGQQPQWRGM